MRRFDVVILGAGPAGATTALALRKSHPHLSVVMIEACDFQTIRPGEILSSDAVPIMQQLDVLNFFMEQNHPQVPIETAHCSNSAGAPDFPGGISNNGGWHLDRARFDGMLAGYAAASGVSFIRATMTE
ncbi:MAG TPA: tryptophan 7-halogenase, partial [Burkholderiaceae bacterium]|nr:tryptophan 7-halogenase [Burkholderiaceae bacterium]